MRPVISSRRPAPPWPRLIVTGLLVLPVLIVVAVMLSSGARARPATRPSPPGPCNIAGAAGQPCVAAYSTVRALYAGYRGPLYRVTRASDRRSTTIGSDPATGIADATAQNAFCAGTSCTITEIYDQSPDRDNLFVAGPGDRIRTNDLPDVAASATALPATLHGHLVYGLRIVPDVGYRDDAARGLARNGHPESMYMVTSSDGVNDQCCFDFGNGSRRNADDGSGHVDAVSFNTRCENFPPCPGRGPWVQADLENGQYLSDTGVSQNPLDTGVHDRFVTAVLNNNGRNYFAIAQGNALRGSLTTEWAGRLPTVVRGIPGSYSPMHQEGAVILGIGGDNSNRGSGDFYEGVITAGMPSDTTDEALQANIVAAGYGRAPRR